LLLGIVPGVYSGRASEDAQKQGSARTLDARRGRAFRNGLVVAEVSFSTLLLIGAGLMMRSLERLTALDPGYNPSHVLTLNVNLPRLDNGAGKGPADTPALPDARAVATANDILQEVSAIPSVTSASIATDVPLGNSSAVFYAAEGQAAMNAQNMPRAYFHRVSPGFFATLGTPFIAGRPFTPEEVRDNANVAIVTENMARRFWPGQDAIGKRIKVGGLSSKRPWLAIVGVVPVMKYRGLPENPTADPDLFQVFNERARGFALLVRISGDVAGISSALRTTLRQAEPSILIYNAATLEDLIASETSRPRFVSWVMAVFAILALLLAAIGIYGVMSYTVSARTREIGLRMALGANREGVLRMVVGRGMGLIAGGLAVGAAAALALTHVMSSFLYGVSSTDPAAFAAASVVLALTAFVACAVPAARASRIDPAVALRNE
jgi:putative ABC transport system permease protein